MRISGTIYESVVDGPGIRCVVFTQGCPHRCPGCHNPHTHAVSGGEERSLDSLKIWKDNPMITGLTISGGEPFIQATDCALLADSAKDDGLDVIVYTGFTMEVLQQAKRDDWRALLARADIVIDSPFLIEQRSLELPFRGSRNQRVWKREGDSFREITDAEFLS